MGKSREQRRALLARLRERVVGRGNDGLTKREREAMAAAYRAKAMGPISEREMDMFRALQVTQRPSRPAVQTHQRRPVKLHARHVG